MKEEYIDNEELEVYEDEEEVLGVDEEIRRNHGEEPEFPDLDVEETPEEEPEEKPKPVKLSESSLLKALRAELAKPEYRRIYFRFKYRGEKCTGIPLHELNEGKYVFLIDNVMRGIYLNEMEML